MLSLVDTVAPSTGYIGCYVDPGPTSNAVVGVEGVFEATLQQCIEWCRAQSVQYAGVMGDTCVCFLDETSLERVPYAMCDEPCPGNHGQICGSTEHATLSVFEIGPYLLSWRVLKL